MLRCMTAQWQQGSSFASKAIARAHSTAQGVHWPTTSTRSKSYIQLDKDRAWKMRRFVKSPTMKRMSYKQALELAGVRTPPAYLKVVYSEIAASVPLSSSLAELLPDSRTCQLAHSDGYSGL